MDEIEARKIKSTIRQIKSKIKYLKASIEQRPSEREKLLLTFKTKQAKLKFTSPSRRSIIGLKDSFQDIIEKLWEKNEMDLGQLSSFAVGKIMNYYDELTQEEIYEMIPIYSKKYVLFQHIIRQVAINNSIIVDECPIPAILLSLGHLCLERHAVNQGFQLIKSYWLKTKNLNKLDSKQILLLSKKHQYESNWLGFLISIYRKKNDYKLFDMIGQENTLYVLNQLFSTKEYDVVLERIVTLNHYKQDNYQLDERYRISKDNIMEFIRKISIHIDSERAEAFVVYLYSFQLDKKRNVERMARIEMDYEYLNGFSFDLLEIYDITLYITSLLDRKDRVQKEERTKLGNLNLLLSIYIANNLRQSESGALDINAVEATILKLQASNHQWKFEPLIDSWVTCTPFKPKPQMYTSLNELLDLTKKELFNTPKSDRVTKDELIATPLSYETPLRRSAVAAKENSINDGFKSSPIKAVEEKSTLEPAQPENCNLYNEQTSNTIKRSNETPKKDSHETLVDFSSDFTTPIKYDLFSYCDENDFDPLTAPIDRKRKENQTTPSLKKLKQSKERYRKPLFSQNESEDELLK
ncbi:hypothetical protein HDV06_006190 [Boothiomyces sp. JEL0866]|nr:hypothetical protein HDV06_006190 [Boothiomyces sp. JEL0866]